MSPGRARVHLGFRALGRRIVPTDQRPEEAVRVAHVVEPEASLDAQAALVGRPVPAPHGHDVAVSNLIRDLAADAAVRTDAVRLFERQPAVGTVRVDPGRLHQRPGRAGLHALAAGHAGLSPWMSKSKHDLGLGAALRPCR